MPDITMCIDGRNCPFNKDCYRYKAKPNPIRQSYANFYHDCFRKNNSKEKCFWKMKDNV